MAKRLNPHRRLLARQAALLNSAKLERSRAHDAEMSKLQRGAVRSSCQAPRVQLTHVTAPRELPLDRPGKVGKVVRGKLVPIPGPARFGRK